MSGVAAQSFSGDRAFTSDRPAFTRYIKPAPEFSGLVLMLQIGRRKCRIDTPEVCSCFSFRRPVTSPVRSVNDPTRTFIAAQRSGNRNAWDDYREYVPSAPSGTAMFLHDLGFDDCHRLKAFGAPRAQRFCNSTHDHYCQTGRLVLRFR